MAKEITVPDILTKLSNIFTKDMYLIDSRYCIGGNETNDESVSKSICILNPDISDIFIDYFGNSSVIFFENIKKAKTAFGTEDEYQYVKTHIEERNKKQLIDNRDNLMKTISNISGWEQFNFTDTEIESIMTDGSVTTLFKDRNDVPEVTVSKSIFPFIKAKDFDKVYYNVSKAKNLKNMYVLIVSYDHVQFQFYNIIYYLKESKKTSNLKTLNT